MGVVYLVLGVLAMGLAVFALIKDINERKKAANPSANQGANKQPTAVKK